MDLTVPTDHRVIIKEYVKKKKKKKKKRDKFLDLAKEKKKLWNMNVTVIPSVIDTFGKSLIRGLKELEIGGRAETIQTTALLRSAKILRGVLETYRDLLSPQWKTTSLHWCEKTRNNNSRTLSIIIIIIIIGRVLET